MPNADDLTILLVDDDEVDRRSVTRSLRQRGIVNGIVQARDGIEALELLRDSTHLAWPYVMLLDINMPRMNGLELLERIRADPDLQGTVVFILTTSDDERDLAAAYAQHVAGYVVKTDAGPGFLELVTMLEHFTLTVRFPADRELAVATDWASSVREVERRP